MGHSVAMPEAQSAITVGGGGRFGRPSIWRFNLAAKFPIPNPGASCFVLPSPCALHAPCLIPCPLLPPNCPPPNRQGTASPPPPVNASRASLPSAQNNGVLIAAFVGLVVCICVNAIEIALKVIVFGPRTFLCNIWNAFDVIVFGLSVGGLWVPALNFAIWLRCFHLVRLYMSGTQVRVCCNGVTAKTNYAPTTFSFL